MKDFRKIRFIFKDAQRRKIVSEHVETYSFFGTSSDDIKEYVFTFNQTTLPTKHESSWKYDHVQEFKRLGFDSPDCKDYFTLNESNEKYELCPSYPKYLFMPAEIEHEDIVGSSLFRSSRRLPSIVWINPKTRSSLSRSSQPQVGVTRNRSIHDENVISSIFRTNKSYGKTGTKMYIIDARSGNAAMANLVIGGYGYENHENYGNNTQIQFMNIPNIHAVRSNFKTFYELCVTSKIPDRTQFEQTGWFSTVKLLLEGASTIAKMISEENSSVLVHCSDGWDRTSQLTSLAQIMLDSYYRTLKGFCILIQKEWLSFGHKFEHRSGMGIRDDASVEISPIFEQWMDCVYQILIQFPNWFEFNEDFLISIVDALHDGMYGDFLFNCERERKESNVQRCASVWSYFEETCKESPLLYCNPHYQQSEKVIFPATTTSKFHVWDSFYLRYNLAFKLHQEYKLLSKEKNRNLCEVQHQLKEVKDLLEKEQYEKLLYYKSFLAAVKDDEQNKNSILEELEDIAKLKDGLVDCEIRFSIKNGRVIGCTVVKDQDTITRKYVGNLNMCKIEDYENRPHTPMMRKIRVKREESIPIARYGYKEYFSSLYDVYETLKQKLFKVVQ